MVNMVAQGSDWDEISRVVGCDSRKEAIVEFMRLKLTEGNELEKATYS